MKFLSLIRQIVLTPAVVNLIHYFVTGPRPGRAGGAPRTGPCPVTGTTPGTAAAGGTGERRRR